MATICIVYQLFRCCFSMSRHVLPAVRLLHHSVAWQLQRSHSSDIADSSRLPLGTVVEQEREECRGETGHDRRLHPSLLHCYLEGNSLGRSDNRFFSLQFYTSWRISRYLSKQTKNLRWVATLLNCREETFCNGPVVIIITNKSLGA